MRAIVNIILIVLIAVIGYNYFFGSSEEKSDSQEIVDQVKDLGKSIGSLITSEKQKMEEGKYDGLFDKVEGIFRTLERQLGANDSDQKEELQDLERDKKALEREVRDAEEHEVSPEKKNELEEKLQELLEKTERLLDKNNEE
ncbi:hypothetical protein KUV50_12300 [Membranicola marinus]|uniref:Uncharacterized protein n=1 Tax=Membranihabitans marinus TaxID=1227546 RepID=A0A953HW63_9BACT|nr:hypothetical protein [Membranihabitans marinus]MBY5958923.1 hypothetical protein [Membranihabitans marinus]